MSGIPMKEISVYPDEEEVLLFPFQTFKVTQIEVVNKNLTKVTLLCITEQVLERFANYNKHFPFQVDTVKKSTYMFEFENNWHCFTNASLRQFGYTPTFEPSFYTKKLLSWFPFNQINTYKLPECHIIAIAIINKFQNEDLISEKSILLIPNIQTLIDFRDKPLKRLCKQTCVVDDKNDDFNETSTDALKAYQIVFEEFFNTETSKKAVTKMINDYKEKDLEGNATSFIIGKDLDANFWKTYLKSGFPHLQNQMKICYINNFIPRLFTEFLAKEKTTEETEEDKKYHKELYSKIFKKF